MMPAFPCPNYIEKWCQQVVDAVHPRNLLFVLRAESEAPDKFALLGVAVSSYQWHESNQRFEYAGPQKASSADRQEQSWDTVAFHQDSLVDFLSCSREEFERLFGAPEKILVWLSPICVEPSLPETSEWLEKLGFIRDIESDLWIDGCQFTALYEKKASPEGLNLKNYESSWWQLSQMNEKRRMLLIEYMDELVITEMRHHEKVEKLNEVKESLTQTAEAVDSHVAVLQNEVQLRIDHIQNLERLYHELERKLGTTHQHLVIEQQKNQVIVEQVAALKRNLQAVQQRNRDLEEQVALSSESLRQAKEKLAYWEKFQNSRLGKLVRVIQDLRKKTAFIRF